MSVHCCKKLFSFKSRCCMFSLTSCFLFCVRRIVIYYMLWLSITLLLSIVIYCYYCYRLNSLLCYKEMFFLQIIVVMKRNTCSLLLKIVLFCELLLSVLCNNNLLCFTCYCCLLCVINNCSYFLSVTR